MSQTQEIRCCHHSYQEEFRKPFGALETGSKVTLSLDVLEGQVEQCWLRVLEKNQEEKLLPMFLHSSSIKQTFTLEYQVPDTPGLVWYHFVLALEGNTLYYGNNFEDLGGEGLLTGSNPHSYQITIYRKSTLPLWYKEGIMYQIYVDRFYNGHEDGAILHPKKKSLLHGDWNDIPMYHRAPDRSIDQWDFFGGNLEGVVKKLPYLEDLGVTILYLNPIFEAASNHKYDTGDYLRIDPMYGDEEGFKTLVAEGEKRGIRIILDGVFSHTGADSIYFNKYGHYGKGGAYQSSESPYSSWYSFKENREEYESWWGVKDLPEVKKMEPSFQSFIYGAPDSVIAKWMDLGVSGWRLDVVDELPGAFVKGLSKRVKEKNPEAVLLGEVWEDASRKVSYGVLRDYFAGDELDGAMNYPLRNLLLDFMLARIPSSMAIHRLYSLYENYPKENFQGAMNILGSHDRERILTLLGDAPSEGSLSEWDKAHFKLSPEAYQRAIGRLKLLALIQMTLPGVPCIYYGDEAGMEGYGDPYNRGTYPWERMNPELLAWYKRLTTIRREYDLWNKGDFEPLTMEDNVFAFRIKKGRETLLVYANRSVDREALVHLNVDYNTCQVFDLLSGGQSKGDYRKLEALEGLILLIQEKVIKDPEEKKAGILLPISALPSPWKIGDLGKPARDFLDFLETSEQRLWQMLPINPLGPGNTPYQSNSVFAGSCMYLSMEQLVEEGILWESEIKIGLKELSASKIEEDRVDYEGNQKVKISLLKKAYRNFRRKVFLGKKRTGYLSRDNYEEFLKKNHEWLESYCLYKVLKKKEYGPLWLEWRRNKEAFVHKLNSRQQSAMDYHRFLQYTFFWQWQEMKAYAATKGIELLGDIPIYVAEDSSITYANPEYFKLDDEGNPYVVAGVPPDYFSKTGQLWGNPIYDWKGMKKDGYAFWKDRFRQGLELYDSLRLDHFRGFEAYFEIPRGARTAEIGVWKKGPGKRLFEALEASLGPLPIVAEDLGVITPEVNNLKNILGYKGMKIYQFSQEDIEEGMFDPEHTVLYSSTHDTDTLLGWYKTLEPNQEIAKQACLDILDRLYGSPAAWVIVPLQDVMLLGSEGRINTPGTVYGNWDWRVKDLDSKWAEVLRSRTRRSQRGHTRAAP